MQSPISALERTTSNSRPSQVETTVNPYADQVNLYHRALQDVARTRGINYCDMPEVCTYGSFQARETDVVVFDAVITSTSSRKDMGFLDEDKRMMVLMTRIPKLMFIVALGEMTNTKKYH